MKASDGRPRGSKYGAVAPLGAGFWQRGPCPVCRAGFSYWHCGLCERSGCSRCAPEPRPAHVAYEANVAELDICGACRRGEELST